MIRTKSTVPSVCNRCWSKIGQILTSRSFSFTSLLQETSKGGRHTYTGKRSQQNFPKQFVASGKNSLATRWLRTQFKDPYVQKRILESYPSRAAFKLIEIDDKKPFLKAGSTVIDLGSAPGGWTVVAGKRVFVPPDNPNDKGKGKVVCVDLLEMTLVPPGCHFIQGDFTEESIQKKILEALDQRHADVLLSDMAPNASGQRDLDHERLMELDEAVLQFAPNVLKVGGTMLIKGSRGGSEQEFKKELEKYFKSVSYMKPNASRAISSEIYFFATGFRQTSKDKAHVSKEKPTVTTSKLIHNESTPHKD